MITRRRLLLLETGLVFLIDNDETQTPEGQEDTATDSDDNVIRPAGEHLLIHFDPLSIRVARMIHPQTVAKDTLQTLSELHRQRNLGQEIEDLPALGKCFMNQMDIQLGLSTAGDTMQEADVMRLPLKVYLIQGMLLCVAQLRHQYLAHRSAGTQSSHRTLIYIEYPARTQGSQRGRCTARGLEQLLASNFLQQLRITQSKCSGKGTHLGITQQETRLGRHALHTSKQCVQFRLVKEIVLYTHAGHHFWLICAPHFFLHQQGTLLEKLLDGGQNMMKTCVALQLVHRLLRLFGQSVEDTCRRSPAPVGIRGTVPQRIHIIRAEHHLALTLQAQAAGESCLAHLTERAEIVVSNPLPQTQLGGQQYGLLVQQFHHLAGGIIRLYVM